MHAGFDLHARQTLSLTPRLQQSVKLLQLSSLEFVQEIRHALATNPFLEEDETPNEEDIEPVTLESDITAPLVSALAPEETVTTTVEVEAPVPETTEMAYEGDAPYEAESDGEDYTYSKGSRQDEDGENEFGEWVTTTPSLREHLHRELLAYRLEERDRILASLIVDSLDEDGYLREDIDELASLIEDPINGGTVDVEELAAALHLVQSLEPAGVGARTLSECLSLQIKALGCDDDVHQLAQVLVLNHLPRLARRDNNELRKQLGCSAETLHAACALIRQLDPRPGAKFGNRQADYIVPDVIVKKVKGKWTAAINPAVMPRARLNKVYADMFHQARCNNRAPLAQELQEARWLLRNAEQRFTTILRVAEAIVTRQRTFFDYGEVALKPLVLRHVAEELGLHESTVSRATGNKYMATPRGIFEFKHFFSRQLATESGGQCSAAAVRALLKEMISAEPADAPLSDVSLAKMLSDQGVVVARRTVSKYRAMMKVPPAELRRQV